MAREGLAPFTPVRPCPSPRRMRPRAFCWAATGNLLQHSRFKSRAQDSLDALRCSPHRTRAVSIFAYKAYRKELLHLDSWSIVKSSSIRQPCSGKLSSRSSSRKFWYRARTTRGLFSIHFCFFPSSCQGICRRCSLRFHDTRCHLHIQSVQHVQVLAVVTFDSLIHIQTPRLELTIGAMLLGHRACLSGFS